MNNGKFWTNRELKRLEKLARAGKSDAEIALLLGRSKVAVQQKRKYTLGIDIRRRWAPEDTEMLKKHIATGTSITEIARLLQRTSYSVQRQKEKLKLRYEPVKISKHCPKTVAQLVKFKMAGWSNQRIAKVFGVKSGGHITNVLRYHGFSSWRLRCQGARTGMPTPRWAELELHFLRKGLKRGDSILKLQEALPRRSRRAIHLKAKEMTRYWRSPEECRKDQERREKWMQWRVY